MSTNLYETVAGRERHLVEVGRVPRAHDDPAVFGPVLDGVDNVGQLKNKDSGLSAISPEFQIS